ncbi:hypothetical protein BKA93DRAFT_877584 [Sparassis latifolia]
MRFSIRSTFLICALAFGVAQASPAPASLERRAEPTVEEATSKAPNADISYPDYDSILFFNGQNCGGTEDIVDIGGLGLNQCYTPNFPYESIMAYSPSGSTWDLTIFACEGGDCQNSVQLPNLNVCYNTLYGGVPAYFYTFYFES